MKPHIFILALLLMTVVSAEDMYNMTSMDNANNIYEYIIAMDTTIDSGVPHPMGIVFMLIVFSMGFIVNGLNTGNLYAGMLAGSFIAVLSGVILLPLGLLDFNVFVIALIIAAVSVAITLIIGKGG